MTYTNSGLFALRRVRYTTEPLTAYAVNQSSSLGLSVFQDILTTEATAELIQEMVDNNAMQQRVDGMLPKVNTRKRCNFSMTSYLNGSGVTASLGSTQTATANNVLLTAIMGGIGGGVTQGILSASSATSFYVSTGSSQYGLQAGSIFGVVNPSTGYLETARVRSLNTATGQLYISHELSFSPTSGSIAQATVANFLTQDTIQPLDGMFVQDPSISTGSLQFFVQGGQEYDQWVLMGLNGGFSLKTEIGQLPEISYKFDGGANWEEGDPAAADFFNPQPDPATYTESVPPPLVNGKCHIYPYETDPTATVPYSSSSKDIFSIEITPNIDWKPITSEGGVNNILRMRRQRAVPVATGKVVIYYNNNDAFNYSLIAGTLLGLELQIGTEVGNTIMISCPRIKVTSVKEIDAGGALGQELTFDCMEDTDAEMLPDFITYAYYPSIDQARSALSIYTL